MSNRYLTDEEIEDECGILLSAVGKYLESEGHEVFDNIRAIATAASDRGYAAAAKEIMEWMGNGSQEDTRHYIMDQLEKWLEEKEDNNNDNSN